MGKQPGRLAEITMKEENGVFALDKHQKISGTININDSEDEMKIRINVKNLKPQDPRRYRYRVLLLGLDKGKSLHKVLGELEPDRNGKDQQEYIIDYGNVDGNGSPLENFSIFMIAAVSYINRAEPYHPVLKGDWDGSWMEIPAEQKREAYNDFYNVFVKEMSDLLVRLKDTYRGIVPFDEKWMADGWYRVDEAGALPLASAGAARQIRKYGHFIFAFNDEYLVLGVPGTNSKPEQPDEGRSGFVRWHPVRGSEIHGYWLIMIQRNAGRIVEFS